MLNAAEIEQAFAALHHSHIKAESREILEALSASDSVMGTITFTYLNAMKAEANEKYSSRRVLGVLSSAALISVTNNK